MISADLRQKINTSGYTTYVEGVGNELDHKPNMVVGRYDFAVQGGAVGAINLLEDLTDVNSLLVIPDDGIIKQVTIDIITAMASAGGTGTIALTAQSAGDLLAAVDADNLSGLVAGVPIGTAATMIKMTADRTLVGAIAVEALTAGKFDVYVEYYRGRS